MTERFRVLLFFLFCFALAQRTGGQASAQVKLEAPQQIEVVAHDYAFEPLPSHIASGPTVFTFAKKSFLSIVYFSPLRQNQTKPFSIVSHPPYVGLFNK